jgi:hypothetical protein
MSPTKLSIQALVVLVLAVPVLAEEAVLPAPGPEEPEMASPADSAMDWPEPDAPVEPEALPDAVLEATPRLEPVAEVSDPEADIAMLPGDESAAPAAPAPGASVFDEPALDEPALDEPGLDTHPPLGAIGYDSEGRRGRIHIVARGDTLWDISNAYLGTPWVWPSIWQDNGEIENPHLIYPGDRIWITPSEMRRLTAEEAALMLSNLPPDPPAAGDPVLPPEPESEPAMIAEPVERGSIRVSSREMAGLISPAQLEAAASLVGRVPERVLLAQEDDVFIGLGESDIDVGDELTAFRTHEKVFDPDSGVLLGYHVEFLGWIQVQETYPETAKATIRMSTSELQEGDRLIPREPLPQEIPLQAGPADVEGKISFFPQKRVVIGFNDFVYLNRGSIDGLEVGSSLSVYRPGYSAEEQARDEEVLVPDFVIGQMVVVRTADESAVALVTNSKTELALGDRFRGAED